MRPPRAASRGRDRPVIRPTSQPTQRGSSDFIEPRRKGNNSINYDRRMENIASVSRSSGLEKDGDMLKERTVQEEFRAFIDSKLKTFWDRYGTASTRSSLASKNQIDSAQKHKKDSQENILILFRKLREGLFASGRKDGFTLEDLVYETSLYLSVIFNLPAQTSSILSRLVPDIYSAIPTPQPFRRVTILVFLLHQLVVSFPSQRTYLEQTKHVSNLLECPCAAYAWISALARSLRTLNFVQFERLSQPDAYEHLLPLSSPLTPLNVSDIVTTMAAYPALPRDAILSLVSRLRSKARDQAWMVVRNVYRELSSSNETQMWLGRRLLFDSFGSEATVVRFDEWVRERCGEGQLRPKEGVEGRWIVCKAR